MVTFIIILILIGLAAGAVARLVVPGRDPMGILGTILLGIAGSFVGGFLWNLIQYHRLAPHKFHLAGILGSILGAIVVLLVLRMTGMGRGRRRVCPDGTQLRRAAASVGPGPAGGVLALRCSALGPGGRDSRRRLVSVSGSSSTAIWHPEAPLPTTSTAPGAGAAGSHRPAVCGGTAGHRGRVLLAGVFAAPPPRAPRGHPRPPPPPANMSHAPPARMRAQAEPRR